MNIKNSRQDNFLKKFFIVFSFLALIVFAVEDVSAQTLVSNSANWEDVYSVMQYASLSGQRSLFTTSERHALVLPYDIGRSEEVLIITSRTPHISGFESIMKSQGITSVKEERINDINLELATRTNVTNFIIIDPAYSYNSISVAPYALLTNSYVLFVDRDNIGRVVSFLNSRTPENILLYGTLQREVRESLSSYNPEIINNNGDKFLNNIEMAKKMLEIKDFGQAILSNGEFIEHELILSGQPIIFVGRSSVPPKVAEFIRSSSISVGVLIGNELINSGQFIRAQTGISTIIKFGRGARIPSGEVMGEIEALDMFYLPPINISITLHELRYNKATNKVEITLRNTGEVAAFIQGSYTLSFGSESVVVGDEGVLFIDAGEFKTFSYQLDERFLDDNIRADVFILFGESENSLEFLYEQRGVAVSIVDYEDSSSLVISDFYYDLSKDAFVVEVTNPGSVDAYATSELIDFFINLETKILPSGQTVKVSSNSKQKMFIPQELIEEDFVNNPSVRVRVYYGEQEDILINVVEEVLPLVKKRSANYSNYLAAALLVTLLVLIVKSSKKCDVCGKRNPGRRRTCKHCNAHLKQKSKRHKF